jgi:hypothetical protein
MSDKFGDESHHADGVKKFPPPDHPAMMVVIILLFPFIIFIVEVWRWWHER